jgi:hypothetical protein
MAQPKERRMPLEVYENLWQLHAGFEQVRRALRSLEQNRTFHAIEEAESNEAGRLFRRRRAREQQEE